MPDLDVTDLLSDPDFADCFDVVRTLTARAADGTTQQTPMTYPGVVGVVTADGGADLHRLADAERVSGVITIHTMFRLVAGAVGITGDKVIWSGDTYTVVSAQDWSRFGAGFTVATCNLLDLQPAAPI